MPHSALSQLDSLLSPNVFSRPATLLSVQLAGVPPSALRSLASAGAQVVERPLLGSSADVSASLLLLDDRSLVAACDAACDAACLVAQLGVDDAAALVLPASPSKALSAFASELACFLRAAQQAASRGETGLLSATLRGYPTLGKEEQPLGGQLLTSTLAAAFSALQAAKTGAAAQLVLLAQAPSAQAVAAAVSRRSLSTAPNPPPAAPSDLGPATDTFMVPPPPLAPGLVARDVKNFSGYVTAFGVGVLLLVAAVGTVIALCTLPTGQDTLLYARNKGD